MATDTVKVNVDIEIERLLNYVRQLGSEANFEQVVLDGIQDIQRLQREFAPKRKHGSIPKSIKAARVVREGQTWSATSRTRLKQAIFTNEGTWSRRADGNTPAAPRYAIPQERRYKTGPRAGESYKIVIWHPGIRAQDWWGKGFEAGKDLALQGFRRKVGRMLRARE